MPVPQSTTETRTTGFRTKYPICQTPADARISTASGLRLCASCGQYHQDWTKTNPSVTSEAK